MQSLPPALAPLGAYRQFMCYVLVPSKTHPSKNDKLPVSPYSGEVATAHDPQNWTTAEHACLCATTWNAQQPGRYGVAFTFTAQDPFFFIDIDGAFDGTNWSSTALEIAGMFPGAAVELSQSGKGMHIIGSGRAPLHGKKNVALGLEFYTELRFVALTGVGAAGNAATDHTAALHALTARYFPAKGTADGNFTLHDGPADEWRGPTDDDDLIRRALQSRSAAGAFGAKVTFADLWERNVDVLSKVWPDAANGFDASSADASLASHLSFWTGRDGARIERLMQRSGLVREKWQRDDYIPRTICEMLARPGEVLVDKLPEPPSTPQASSSAPTQTAITGSTFLNPEAQRALFAGCVYVEDMHRVWVPGGALKDSAKFRTSFGGYTFAMDDLNRATTRNAWEAFTESQVLRAPRASTICFKPDRAPGEIIEDAGFTMVNTYWPAKVKREVGDVTPFLNHLAKLLPDERDRRILLSYMAACVQYKGVKFQWCPVLQGPEGNGKSFLSSCLSQAIGQKYVHWPNAKALESNFNAWMVSKILIAVEELRPRGRELAEEVVEQLKTLIAGGIAMGVEFKGIDQLSMEMVANFFCTTNHRDAIKRTADNSRRFANFYCAQQTYAEMLRDGLGPDYHPPLWEWARTGGGYAIVSELLHTYPIDPEFNPAGACRRAPTTSTTAQSIVESRGSIEQHIAEAIAQDSLGFMGGWISSVMLDKFLTETLRVGGKLSPTKRHEMLAGMGYMLHPGLPDGRVNNPVQPDGRKSQLFVLASSPLVHIRGAAEIARAYTAAQLTSMARHA